MPELVIPTGTAQIQHAQPIVADLGGDSGLPLRIRSRSARWQRMWTVVWPRATRGELILIREAFEAGAFGAAELDWTPPGAGSSSVVLFASLQYQQTGKQQYQITAELEEQLSADA